VHKSGQQNQHDSGERHSCFPCWWGQPGISSLDEHVICDR